MCLFYPSKPSILQYKEFNIINMYVYEDVCMCVYMYMYVYVFLSNMYEKGVI